MAWIKKTYLYLVSLVSLIIMVIGAIMLINLALKAWVFTKADNYASYPICATQPEAAKTGTQADGSPACDQAAMDAQKKIDDTNRSSQKQSQASNAIAMIVVAAPVFYYHWRLARKEA